MDVGEGQGGKEKQQPSSRGGWDRGAETALGLPDCPSHLLCDDFLRKHPVGRMALFGEALHKLHPLLAGLPKGLKSERENVTMEAVVGVTGYENGRKIHEPQNANVASTR